MEKTEYETLLSLKKQEFIQRVMAETSLDTLCSWLDMHEEARYVASLDDKVSLYIEPILLENGEDSPIYREVMRTGVAV